MQFFVSICSLADCFSIHVLLDIKQKSGNKLKQTRLENKMGKFLVLIQELTLFCLFIK